MTDNRLIELADMADQVYRRGTSSDGLHKLYLGFREIWAEIRTLQARRERELVIATKLLTIARRNRLELTKSEQDKLQIYLDVAAELGFILPEDQHRRIMELVALNRLLCKV